MRAKVRRQRRGGIRVENRLLARRTSAVEIAGDRGVRVDAQEPAHRFDVGLCYTSVIF